MLRRAINILLHLAAGLSLALCIATAVAWARGGWNQKQFHRIIGRWEYCTDGGSFNDLIQIVIVHWWPAPIVGPSTRTTGPTADAWINQSPHFWLNSGGFGLHYWMELGTSRGGNWTMSGRRLDIHASFDGAMIILLILPTLVWGLLPIRRRGIRSIEHKPEDATEPALITADLPCVHCGYNLRTQRTRARCPECGSPVSDSLRLIDDLAKAPAAWLRRLAAGALLLFLARIMLAATFATLFQRNGGFVTEYIPALACAIAEVVLYAAGIFLITLPEFPHLQPSRRKAAIRLRKVAATSLVCIAAGIAYQAIETAIAPRPFGLMGSVSVQWYWASSILLLVGWILYCYCMMLEFLFLSQLARRIGDHTLARTCLWAGAGATATSVALLYGAQRIIDQWTLLGIFRAVIVAWFLIVLWTALINLDFAARFRKLSSPLSVQQSD